MKNRIAITVILSVAVLSLLVFTNPSYADTVYRYEQDVYYFVKSEGSWSLEAHVHQSKEYRYIDNKPWTTYKTWHRNVYVFIDKDEGTVNTVYKDWEYQGSHTE